MGLGDRWRQLKGWATDSTRFMLSSPVRVAALVGALGAGAVAGGVVGDAGFDYTWKDPHFCNDCHVHDYADEAFFRSIHAGVTTCHDCHKVPLIHYPHNLRLMITGPPQTPEEVHTPSIPTVLCGTCHLEHGHKEELTGPMPADLQAEVVKVDESPLHKLHLEAESRTPSEYQGGEHGTTGAGDGAHEGTEGEAHEADDDEHGPQSDTIECMDCHSSGGNLEAHRFSAQRENCIECHEGIDVSVGRLQVLSCSECHFSGFVGERPGGRAPIAD